MGWVNASLCVPVLLCASLCFSELLCGGSGSGWVGLGKMRQMGWVNASLCFSVLLCVSLCEVGVVVGLVVVVGRCLEVSIWQTRMCGVFQPTTHPPTPKNTRNCTGYPVLVAGAMAKRNWHAHTMLSVALRRAPLLCGLAHAQTQSICPGLISALPPPNGRREIRPELGSLHLARSSSSESTYSGHRQGPSH